MDSKGRAPYTRRNRLTNIGILVDREPVITIKNLETSFRTDAGVVMAVDGLDLTVEAGSTLGLVGESGCGKSTVGLSIMRLIPEPPGMIAADGVLFDVVDLLRLKEREMRKIRGNSISMIFQEPMTSLNPVRRVGDTIVEVIKLHRKVSQREATERAIEALRQVQLPSPEIRMRDYPHQMSGGMRQRVMIALAISCDPSLVIADEPTTALDVTIQAQILALLNQIQGQLKTSIILITHDLGIIAENTSQVAVMYAGKLVEYATTKGLFDNPLHPYTEGLLRSVPRLGTKEGKKKRLSVISGNVPNLLSLPPGCMFEDRCPEAFDRCREQVPELIALGEGQFVRCWKYS